MKKVTTAWKTKKKVTTAWKKQKVNEKVKK